MSLSDVDLDRIEAAARAMVDKYGAGQRSQADADTLDLVAEVRRLRAGQTSGGCTHPRSQRIVDPDRFYCGACGRDLDPDTGYPEPAPLETGRWKRSEFNAGVWGWFGGDLGGTPDAPLCWWSTEHGVEGTTSRLDADDYVALAAIIRNEERDA